MLKFADPASGQKHDLAAGMTLREILIGIAYIGQTIYPGDRNFEAAGNRSSQQVHQAPWRSPPHLLYAVLFLLLRLDKARARVADVVKDFGEIEGLDAGRNWSRSAIFAA